MSEWLDPTGRGTYGIGICDRCKVKFSIEELHPDPNSPGLRVCVDCLDEYDPYRLPARQTENIALQFTRPDSPLTGVGPISAANRPPGDIFLSLSGGSSLVTLSWTLPDDPPSSYRVYRSVDGGAFLLLASGLPLTPRTYNDGTVDRSVHSYQYYVTYIDAAFGIESSPSNVVTASKINALVAIAASDVVPKAMRSVDGGLTWASVVAFPLPRSPQPFHSGLAYSQSRNRLVATSGLASNSNVAYSDDLGVTWTLVNKGSNEALQTVVYAPWLDKFFAGGFFDGVHNCPVMQSADGGQTWAVVNTTGGSQTSAMQCMYVLPELQLIFGWNGNRLCYSSDGVAWTVSAASFIAAPHGESAQTTYTNYDPVTNKYVWGGTGNGNFWYATPPTGVAVDTGQAGGGSALTPVAWSPSVGLFLAMHDNPGNPQDAWYSPTALAGTWTHYVPPIDTPANGLIWSRGGNRYVAVGNRAALGKVAWSTDVLNWTRFNTPDNSNSVWELVIECI